MFGVQLPAPPADKKSISSQKSKEPSTKRKTANSTKAAKKTKVTSKAAGLEPAVPLDEVGSLPSSLSSRLSSPYSNTVTPAPGINPPTPAPRIDPPAHGIDPPARGVDPPAHGVDPPAHSVDPPAHGVDPPAHGVDPPAHGVDPPARGIDPPARGVDPLAPGIDHSAPGIGRPASGGDHIILGDSRGDNQTSTLLPTSRTAAAVVSADVLSNIATASSAAQSLNNHGANAPGSVFPTFNVPALPPAFYGQPQLGRAPGNVLMGSSDVISGLAEAEAPYALPEEATSSVQDSLATFIATMNSAENATQRELSIVPDVNKSERSHRVSDTMRFVFPTVSTTGIYVHQNDLNASATQLEFNPANVAFQDPSPTASATLDTNTDAEIHNHLDEASLGCAPNSALERCDDWEDIEPAPDADDDDDMISGDEMSDTEDPSIPNRPGAISKAAKLKLKEFIKYADQFKLDLAKQTGRSLDVVAKWIGRPPLISSRAENRWQVWQGWYAAHHPKIKASADGSVKAESTTTFAHRKRLAYHARLAGHQTWQEKKAAMQDCYDWWHTKRQEFLGKLVGEGKTNTLVTNAARQLSSVSEHWHSQTGLHIFGIIIDTAGGNYIMTGGSPLWPRLRARFPKNLHKYIMECRALVTILEQNEDGSPIVTDEQLEGLIPIEKSDSTGNADDPTDPKPSEPAACADGADADGEEESDDDQDPTRDDCDKTLRRMILELCQQPEIGITRNKFMWGTCMEYLVENEISIYNWNPDATMTETKVAGRQNEIAFNFHVRNKPWRDRGQVPILMGYIPKTGWKGKEEIIDTPYGRQIVLYCAQVTQAYYDAVIQEAQDIASPSAANAAHSKQKMKRREKSAPATTKKRQRSGRHTKDSAPAETDSPARPTGSGSQTTRRGHVLGTIPTAHNYVNPLLNARMKKDKPYIDVGSDDEQVAQDSVPVAFDLAATSTPMTTYPQGLEDGRMDVDEIEFVDDTHVSPFAHPGSAAQDYAPEWNALMQPQWQDSTMAQPPADPQVSAKNSLPPILESLEGELPESCADFVQRH
ncbi:hypothetical protein PUNSTDRAFT_132641 [Punctularia strigosozonata HHB-11173 SS5]|uniref:uncharacterized protein n=1 Tax=Punctularia strigosozonata (strain HHB-11173) TaxID=741275 RepID=UPI0004416F7A|nr:uncharacterized protein PUNSTDRAFT_132641 [Punctularia strigosozonata HHB-11173 SS5]EIN10552.1 hypothetical protein PUNSTDRAFT_132641 [Punctularia strigosozonata HHB-11173 SS5]